MSTVVSQDQEALNAEIAEVREKITRLKKKLRAVETELEGMSHDRERYHLLNDICRGLDKLEELGGARGKAPAQMALGWLLTKEFVAAPIVGANTPDQLANSLGAAGLKLSGEEMTVLDEMSGW